MNGTRQVAFRMPSDLLAEVDREAATDTRSRSNMIERLLREALAARQAARDERDILWPRDEPSFPVDPDPPSGRGR